MQPASANRVDALLLAMPGTSRSPQADFVKRGARWCLSPGRYSGEPGHTVSPLFLKREYRNTLGALDAPELKALFAPGVVARGCGSRTSLPPTPIAFCHPKLRRGRPKPGDRKGQGCPQRRRLKSACGCHHKACQFS